MLHVISSPRIARDSQTILHWLREYVVVVVLVVIVATANAAAGATGVAGAAATTAVTVADLLLYSLLL